MRTALWRSGTSRLPGPVSAVTFARLYVVHVRRGSHAYIHTNTFTRTHSRARKPEARCSSPTEDMCFSCVARCGRERSASGTCNRSKSRRWGLRPAVPVPATASISPRQERFFPAYNCNTQCQCEWAARRGLCRGGGVACSAAVCRRESGDGGRPLRGGCSGAWYGGQPGRR